MRDNVWELLDYFVASNDAWSASPCRGEGKVLQPAYISVGLSECVTQSWVAPVSLCTDVVASPKESEASEEEEDRNVVLDKASQLIGNGQEDKIRSFPKCVTQSRIASVSWGASCSEAPLEKEKIRSSSKCATQSRIASVSWDVSSSDVSLGSEELDDLMLRVARSSLSSSIRDPRSSTVVGSTLCHTYLYESAVGSSTVGSSAVWSSADVVGSSVVGISSAAVGSSIVGSSMVGSSSAAFGSAVGNPTVGSAVGSAGLQKKNVRFAPEGTAHQKLVPHEVAHKSKDAANHNPSSSSSSSVGSSAVGSSADAVGSSIVGSSMVGSSSAAVGSAVGSSTVGRAVGSAVVWSSADAVGSSSAVGSSTVRSAVGSSTVRSSADAVVDAVGSSTVGSSAVGSSAVWSSADAVGSSTTGSLANAVGSSTVGSSAVGSSADAVGSSAVGCSVDAVGSSIVGSPADAAGSSAVGSSTARARENPSDVSVPDPQPDRSSDHPELKRMTDKFVEYFLARDNHPQGYARTVSRLLRQTDEELTTSYCNMVGRLRDLGIPSTGRLHSTRRVLTAMTHAIQSVADGENPKEIALNMQEDMLSDSDAEPPSPESLQICCQNPSVKSRRKGRNRNRGKSSKT